MAERVEDPRLVKLREEGVKIYSISRLNAMHTCPYQAYMNYVKGIKGTNVGIYGELGGIVHDCIQGTILGTNKPEDLKDAIQKELDDLEALGVDFPLSKDGSPSIRNNWVANMTRFAEEYKTPTGKFDTEKLLLLPIDENHVLQGYADAIKYLPGNRLFLIDWKTSSQFVGDHLIEAGRQLAVYSMALEKLGFFVGKAAWVMVKYCQTSYQTSNGSRKTKVSEWRNLIKDLKPTIEKTMQSMGYGEIDIEMAIADGLKTNKWSSFPRDVQQRFRTSIYVREYEITDEIKEETMKYIKDTINLYESLGEDEDNWKPCDIEHQSFMCNALCQFGGKSGQCKYYVDFCNKFTKENDDEGLFE